jgi:hypothetical protein
LLFSDLLEAAGWTHLVYIIILIVCMHYV